MSGLSSVGSPIRSCRMEVDSKGGHSCTPANCTLSMCNCHNDAQLDSNADSGVTGPKSRWASSDMVKEEEENTRSQSNRTQDANTTSKSGRASENQRASGKGATDPSTEAKLNQLQPCTWMLSSTRREIEGALRSAQNWCTNRQIAGCAEAREKVQIVQLKVQMKVGLCKLKSKGEPRRGQTQVDDNRRPEKQGPEYNALPETTHPEQGKGMEHGKAKTIERDGIAKDIGGSQN
ncbi:hypothetical protein B0H16DRAFT_1461948 [Mycena metata]|uniref:Uncharacterized protein n=1 Tax=Mycena metata TaxID=1033252 RepID=A0AAD7N7A1_9AGAR|nr:hypothetical protein B0H16DRAFT_1461948 [Mycena metata]